MSTQASRYVLIINKLGLHARAASKLAQLSQKFTAKVTIELDENHADANSIMGIMLLAGAPVSYTHLTLPTTPYV